MFKLVSFDFPCRRSWTLLPIVFGCFSVVLNCVRSCLVVPVALVG